MIDWNSYGIEPNSNVTKQMIEDIERKLNISFPKEYLDLVKYCDEAVFEVGEFEYEDGASCISEFFKFTNKEELYSLLWYQSNSIQLPKKLIPIGRDAGDYLICLDFNTQAPTVKLYIPNEKKLVDIADSFKEFIFSLEE